MGGGVMGAVRDFVQFEFDSSSPSGKTSVWKVINRSFEGSTGVYLGVVKWYGAWRCYAFFPTRDTLFESKCLTQIAKFCKEQTDLHMGRVPSPD
jgi:hypothetical protein